MTYTAKQANDILSMFEGAQSLDRNSIILVFGAFRATIDELKRRESLEKPAL